GRSRQAPKCPPHQQRPRDDQNRKRKIIGLVIIFQPKQPRTPQQRQSQPKADHSPPPTGAGAGIAGCVAGICLGGIHRVSSVRSVKNHRQKSAFSRMPSNGRPSSHSRFLFIAKPVSPTSTNVPLLKWRSIITGSPLGPLAITRTPEAIRSFPIKPTGQAAWKRTNSA